jgi:hypothetical protein
MALPVLTLHLARTKLGAYCTHRIPEHVRDQVRLELEFAENHVTLIETRPHFRDPSLWSRLPVARFRFNAGAGTWALLSPGFGSKEAWRSYPAQPSRDLDKLIAVLDADEKGVFWG